MPEPDFANFETNEAESNAEYINQIRYQVEGPREDDEAELQSYLSCTLTQSKSNVLHGSKIALQTLYDRPKWLDCTDPKSCTKTGCAKLYMEGDDDWKNCGGEVFQIYRAAGAGNIRVGDNVGLYAGGDSWFSLHDGKGHKDPCPGAPTIKYGFATQQKWYDCFGEVFQIYASRKPFGDTIQDQDDIALYYVKDRKWVSFTGTNPSLHPCPGEVRPPPPDRFDVCFGEVTKLWLHKN